LVLQNKTNQIQVNKNQHDIYRGRISKMSEHHFKHVDFENPSFLFVLEDMVKNLIGGKLFYNSYFKTFSLKGNEKVLDFGCGGGTGAKCLLTFLNEDGHLTCVDASH